MRGEVRRTNSLEEAPFDRLLEELGIEPPCEEEILRRVAPLQARPNLAGAIKRDMECELALAEALRLLLESGGVEDRDSVSHRTRGAADLHVRGSPRT